MIKMPNRSAFIFYLSLIHLSLGLFYVPPQNGLIISSSGDVGGPVHPSLDPSNKCKHMENQYEYSKWFTESFFPRSALAHTMYSPFASYFAAPVNFHSLSNMHKIFHTQITLFRSAVRQIYFWLFFGPGRARVGECFFFVFFLAEIRSSAFAYS